MSKAYTHFEKPYPFGCILLVVVTICRIHNHLSDAAAYLASFAAAVNIIAKVVAVLRMLQPAIQFQAAQGQIRVYALSALLQF